MGDRIRTFDWSATPLGAAEHWPASLRTLTSLMLNSRQAMSIVWGPDLILLYNDGCIPLLGNRHPRGLGRSYPGILPEAWEQLEPFAERALAGESICCEDFYIPLMRNGMLESAWFTFSYTPVRDDTGTVAGIFCVISETTAKVLETNRTLFERERLSQMFNQAPGFMAIVRGPDHILELSNAAFRRAMGGRVAIDQPLRLIVPELEQQGYIGLLDDVYRKGKAFRGSAMLIRLQQPNRRPVREHYVDLIFQPISDESGSITGIFIQGTDVSERVYAEVALREREEYLAALFAQSAAGIVFMDMDGRLTMVNDRFCEISGRAREELLQLSCRDFTHPEDLEENDQSFARLKIDGVPYVIEKRYIRPDGSVIWISNFVSLIRPASQLKRGAVAVCIDVTERRRAEEYQELLINELNHRVKNSLAIVQGLAQQSFKRDVPMQEARQAFDRRLAALAAAHDLLTQENWKSASLRQAVEDAVAPYRTAERDCFHIDGPSLRLPPKAAVTLIMAMHELASNAVKYGALASDKGSIHIRWHVTDSAAGKHLKLQWMERGGPTVSPPTRRGFGSRLIEHGLAAEFGGKVHVDYAPEGLICTLDTYLPHTPDWLQ